jgi:hypothetical protein
VANDEVLSTDVRPGEERVVPFGLSDGFVPVLFVQRVEGPAISLVSPLFRLITDFSALVSTSNSILCFTVSAFFSLSHLSSILWKGQNFQSISATC